MSSELDIDFEQLAQDIKTWGKELGFQQIGISGIDLSHNKERLQTWLEKQYHGQMSFLEMNVEKRLDPTQLVPETASIISVRMNYLPPDALFAKTLNKPSKAYVSRYAVGRDYHKVLRQRLKQLALKIQTVVPELQFRPFTDSAPVLEHAIAEKAGIGWTGKHTLTINKEAGSWFFLGELFVNLPLPNDAPVKEQCGSCVACLKICPTQAIVAPYEVDARRCISYLTIENDDEIPIEFRKSMGNRIYGCDDCQLVCPWNRFAQLTEEKDFFGRNNLLSEDLLTLFAWNEDTFLRKTEGSAIRRIGWQKWQRNIAVALGNSPYSQQIVNALESSVSGASSLVKEHVVWALEQQRQKKENIDNAGIDIEMERAHNRLIRTIEKGLPRDA